MSKADWVRFHAIQLSLANPRRADTHWCYQTAKQFYEDLNKYMGEDLNRTEIINTLVEQTVLNHQPYQPKKKGRPPRKNIEG